MLQISSDNGELVRDDVQAESGNVTFEEGDSEKLLPITVLADQVSCAVSIKQILILTRKTAETAENPARLPKHLL